MTFSERMKEVLEQGLAASKDLAIKAGAKAQNLGEQGVLMLEIKQLEGQAQKLLARLGNEAYTAFIERDTPLLDRDSTEIKTLLEQLSMLKDTIEKKEAGLKKLKS